MTAIPRVGSEIAGFRLESFIARGGMAVVYVADHIRLGRKVALKILAPEVSEDDRFRERFLRESRIAASINHPNIIPIYDAGEEGGLLYIAMRYVDGMDLKELLEQEGKFDAQRTLSIIGQVGGALDAAHAIGLVHRDVKPANILLVPRDSPEGLDHVYLTDFGLTKHAHSRSGLTMTGQFVGSIDYVAPEQVEAKPIDGRTDIYSLGCVFYQCLTGSLPYDREGDVAVVWAHLREPPPRVTERRSDLPAQIDDVVAKAMAKSQDERFQTCREFMNAARAAFKPIATKPSLTAAPVKETVVSPQPGLRERDPQTVASAGVAAAPPVVRRDVEPGPAPASTGESGASAPATEAPSAPARPAPPTRRERGAARRPARRSVLVFVGIGAFLLGAIAPSLVLLGRKGVTPAVILELRRAALYETLLQSHIPIDIRSSCEPIDTPKPLLQQPSEVFITARCLPKQGIEYVWYDAFHSQASMTDALHNLHNNPSLSAETGDYALGSATTCAGTTAGVSAFSFWTRPAVAPNGHLEQRARDKTTHGQLLCLWDSANQRFEIDWTDNQTNIYSTAVALTIHKLYIWWKYNSGPLPETSAGPLPKTSAGPLPLPSPSASRETTSP